MLKNAFCQFKTRTLARDLAIGLALTVASVLLGIGAVNYALTVTKMERDLAVQSRVLAEKLASILSLPSAFWTTMAICCMTVRPQRTTSWCARKNQFTTPVS